MYRELSHKFILTIRTCDKNLIYTLALIFNHFHNPYQTCPQHSVPHKYTINTMKCVYKTQSNTYFLNHQLFCKRERDLNLFYLFHITRVICSRYKIFLFKLINLINNYKEYNNGL